MSLKMDDTYYKYCIDFTSSASLVESRKVLNALTVPLFAWLFNLISLFTMVYCLSRNECLGKSTIYADIIYHSD